MLADKVPNQFPSKASVRRIAIVAEAPATHERSWHTCMACRHEFATEWRDMHGAHRLDYCPQCFKRDLASTPKPLVGPSGWLLNKLLAEAGIDRAACFVGNVCQVQAPGNDINRFKWDGSEITEGLLQLSIDLAAFQPHFCLLLGNTPLRAFKAVLSEQPKCNIGDWRGSLFTSYLPQRLVEEGDKRMLKPTKCLATYHPAALLREAGLTREARHDIKRAAEEARTDDLVVPVDEIATDCTKLDLLLRLSLVKEKRLRVAVDIEGGCGAVSCIGFATSSNAAFVVPFIRADGTSYWSDPEDEVALWQAVADVLTDPEVPKVLQNYLYDAFVLAWSYGILIRGLADDIMLKHFELSCESEKSLGYQTSIYTRHPFYKFERKSDDEKVQLTYCGKDCCRTFECNVAQDAMLMPRQREHYEMNVRLLAPLLYMELRGIRYDKDEAQRRLAATQKRIHALQDRINREASGGRPALAAFYQALHNGPVEDRASADLVGHAALEVRDNPGGARAEDNHQPGVEGGDVSPPLVQLLATAFCLARRTERRVVEEHFYEPQRWNGKKWCKAGKRIVCRNGETEQAGVKASGKGGKATGSEAVQAAVAQGAWQGNQAPSLLATDKGQTWLKPVTKQVERNVQVEVATLDDVLRFSKDSQRADCKRAIHILGRDLPRKGAAASCHLTPAQRGELATLLGIHVKVNATAAEGDAQWFLYEHCRLPKQFKKENGRLTDRLASDDEAIIKAWVKVKDRRAIWFLNLRQLVTSTKSLAAEPDADGRIRCGYNGVGAETHRLTCYGSPTGSSDLNLQTVTKGHRCLYKADDGHWMAQRDLSGADGFTTAAYMAMLGDDTMLCDYAAKLKPAQILVLMLDRGAAVNKLSRDELKPLCKPITEESDWRYFAMKRVQHGGSYMMWKNTMSDQILTDSFKKTGKPIYVPPNKCEEMLTKCLFVRYPGIPRWHAWMERELKEKGRLVASDGFQRHFYGRKDDKATVKAALAHLPQYYTTRATMVALMRLWSDTENRRADGSLRIEPLHTVHDSLVTQFHKDELEWAKVKLDAWFQNPFLIAQTMLTIPASGTYGESWGEQGYAL